jgi:hypothetical protein
LWALDARDFHFPDKPVSSLCHRLDVSWAVRGIRKRLPEPGDCGVQAMFKIAERVIGPKPAAQVIPGHHRSRVFQQCGQYLEELFLEFDSHTVFAQNSLT